MAALVSFLLGLLKLFLPALAEANRDTSEEATADPDLKSRLQGAIRDAWKPAAVVLLCMTCCGCFLSRGTRTVYVPDGTPVRLAEDVRGVLVEVPVDGEVVKTEMDLKAGWYVLSDPGETED